MKPGTIVRDGLLEGVVTYDLPGPLAICNYEEEVPVQWYGNADISPALTQDLEEIGPEDPRPDPMACGAGRGAECCRFLTCGPRGFACERHTKLRFTLQTAKDFTAQREPVERYPDCMKFKKEK